MNASATVELEATFIQSTATQVWLAFGGGLPSILARSDVLFDGDFDLLERYERVEVTISRRVAFAKGLI